MSTNWLYNFDDDYALGAHLAQRLSMPLLEVERRQFPDGESYVRVVSSVEPGDNITIVKTLVNPDADYLRLAFICQTLRELGAAKVLLVSPYLSYMRQDKAFKPGEGVTSRYFANMLSQLVDALITVDPHLHRHHDLSEIYPIPTLNIAASGLIATWIKTNIKNPVLIGPDEESEQWVSKIAEKADVDYLVLKKIRSGDRSVSIESVCHQLDDERQSVLVDDIISTGTTMKVIARELLDHGVPKPVCIGVHALCQQSDYEALAALTKTIVTTNTVNHSSNAIDLAPLIAESLVS